MTNRACESCGREEEDDELTVVHRLYVTPETWDNPGSVSKVETTELWCFSCRSMYPHTEIDTDTAP